LCDYKKKLAEKETIQKILTARFEKYTKSRNPHTSHTDSLHRQLTPPFLLTTPRVFDKPLEFLVAGIEHIASWSEADSRGGSSPHQKGMRAVKRFSSSFYAVVVQRQRHGPPLNGVPDSSSIVLLSTVTLYKSLGKISDILYLNNKNNQLEK